MSGCGCDGAKCRLEVGDPRHGRPTGYDYHKCKCTPCRAAKLESGARYRAENAEKERERHARYFAENPEKVRENQARYRAKNPEKVRETNARYYAENLEKEREKRRERQVRYRAEHPGKVREQQARYRAKHAEKVRENQARYRAENAEKRRAYNASYRASPEGKAVDRACQLRRRDRELARCCGCYTANNLPLVWALDDGLCAYCGDPGTTIDHIVPLRPVHASTDEVGGWGCINNFRLACKRCNSKKRNMPLPDFLARLAASGVTIREGATNSGLPCPAAAERMSRRMLTASPTSLN